VQSTWRQSPGSEGLDQFSRKLLLAKTSTFSPSCGIISMHSIGGVKMSELTNSVQTQDWLNVTRGVVMLFCVESPLPARYSISAGAQATAPLTLTTALNIAQRVIEDRRGLLIRLSGQ